MKLSDGSCSILSLVVDNARKEAILHLIDVGGVPFTNCSITSCTTLRGHFEPPPRRPAVFFLEMEFLHCIQITFFSICFLVYK